MFPNLLLHAPLTPSVIHEWASSIGPSRGISQDLPDSSYFLGNLCVGKVLTMCVYSSITLFHFKPLLCVSPPSCLFTGTWSSPCWTVRPSCHCLLSRSWCNREHSTRPSQRCCLPRRCNLRTWSGFRHGGPPGFSQTCRKPSRAQSPCRARSILS